MESVEIGGLDGEWVAVIIVQRQRDAAIAAVGDDLQCIFEFVLGKPVCVITETQVHLDRLERRLARTDPARKIARVC